jgi:hypothetical protein
MEIQQFEEKLTDGPATLHVMNEIGSITIERSNGNSNGDSHTIHINAESRGMVVTVSNVDNHVTVRAEREDTWRNPIEQVKALFSQEHPKAHLTIQVPADCVVNAKMVTGSLAVSGIEGMVNGRVVTGSAELANLSGPINVKTVTGNLTYHGQISNDIHHFKTVTGTVRLNLTHLPDARLDARTDVGGIQCDVGKGNGRVITKHRRQPPARCPGQRPRSPQNPCCHRKHPPQPFHQ